MLTIRSASAPAASSHPSLPRFERNPADTLAAVRAAIEREYAVAGRGQPPRLLRLALNEAEALAWQTGVPHLVFPVLAREKAESISEWYRRQNAIRQISPSLAFAE